MNTRRAYGWALASFFAFIEDGGRERVQLYRVNRPSWRTK